MEFEKSSASRVRNTDMRIKNCQEVLNLENKYKASWQLVQPKMRK